MCNRFSLQNKTKRKLTETINSRVDIGFDKKENWHHALAVYTEHTLEINNHPVMEDWETPYMKELAQIATQNGGRILEIGFGMGISSCFIHQHNIEEHVIIEANEHVYQYALSSSKDYPQKTTVHLGFWEDVTPHFSDESFDGILFDTYPLEELLIHCNHFPFFNEAFRLLKSGGIFTYYSDEVDSFSLEHLEFLKEAGWSEPDARICPVTPPPECKYWKAKTILAPILIKQ